MNNSESKKLLEHMNFLLKKMYDIDFSEWNETSNKKTNIPIKTVLTENAANPFDIEK
jgi:hypothetical protein